MATAYTNPKLMMAIREAPASGSLWAMGMSYVAHQQTDGAIPEFQVPRLLPLPDTETMLLAAVLERYGLWDKMNGGYMIHDWLDYNPSFRSCSNSVRRRRRRQTLAGTGSEMHLHLHLHLRVQCE